MKCNTKQLSITHTCVLTAAYRILYAKFRNETHPGADLATIRHPHLRAHCNFSKLDQRYDWKFLIQNVNQNQRNTKLTEM
jgi:hypothetical protein